MDPNRITYFGETDFRNQRTRFGIKAIDRTKHVYVIGKSGMGKSTLLENMAVQDIQNGEGIAFLDPHGNAAEKLLHYVPDNRINDVVYFAPFDLEYPIALNVMEDVGPDKRHLVASGLMSAFKKIWVDAWSARMEYILNNTILALLEYPGATLLSVNKMLADKDFRKEVLEHVTDLSVKSFWVDEFAKYTERMAQEAVPAIQNKVGQFTANPVIRNIIGQVKSSFDIREAMDTKKIVIINLSKGRLGEQNASLLGALIITKIYLAAMSRADVPESVSKSLPSFNFFVDEFQSFASDSFADILSEARKYKLCLHLAHQYVEQMSDQVKAAVFGNVGTMIAFRVGSTDALIFEKEFAPTFTAEDVVNLDFAQMYLRMTIDGIGSKPFSAKGLAPIAPPKYSNKDEVIDASRRNYASPRSEVEEVIKKLLESKPVENKKTKNNVFDTSSGMPKKNFENKETNEKVRQAFKGVLEEFKEETKKEDPKPKGFIERIEDEVRSETEAIVSIEKAYNNKFSQKFVKEEPVKNNFKQYPKPVDKQGYKKPIKDFKQKTQETVNIQSKEPQKIKPFVDRSAKPESMSALKDLLNQVVSGSKNGQEIESKADIQNTATTNKPGPIEDVDKNKIPDSLVKNQEKDIVKEVPEDVLKRILSQE